MDSRLVRCPANRRRWCDCFWMGHRFVGGFDRRALAAAGALRGGSFGRRADGLDRCRGRVDAAFSGKAKEPGMGFWCRGPRRSFVLAASVCNAFGVLLVV